jgi:putative transcriptional regulator
MIHLQIKELIAAKSAQWGRRVTISEVAEATGISRMTLNRMMRHQGYNTVTDHLDKLCSYFECNLNELVRYVPSATASNDKHATLIA